MIHYSGENWEPYAPYISAGAHASTLGMTDGEKWEAFKRRRPIGFAPPVEMPKRPAGKPRIRLKAR